MDEFNRVMVKLARQKSEEYTLFNPGGELNEKLPKSITNVLGPPAEEVVMKNEDNISAKRKRLETLEEQKAESTSEDIKADITNQMEDIENELTQLEQENEGIEENMSLHDRIKITLKKYGKAKVAKLGVGNGLKEIGNKLGAILPGMVGAITSFIFRTAGEVVGFLAKNAWLLIVPVVIYFVENLKKKKR